MLLKSITCRKDRSLCASRLGDALLMSEYRFRIWQDILVESVAASFDSARSGSLHGALDNGNDEDDHRFTVAAGDTTQACFLLPIFTVRAGPGA